MLLHPVRRQRSHRGQRAGPQIAGRYGLQEGLPVIVARDQEVSASCYFTQSAASVPTVANVLGRRLQGGMDCRKACP